MRAFKDDRSRAYNDVFPAIGVGDVNVAVLYPGTIKAFHRHQKQDDHWFIAKGNVRVVCVEERPVTRTTYYTDWIPTVRYRLGSTVALPDGTVAEEKYGQLSRETKHQVSEDPEEWSTVLYRYYGNQQDVERTVVVSYLSEGDSLHIKAGIWHGVQALGNEESIMLYHITNKYNEEEPDEERAEWNALYDWAISRK